MIRVLIFLGKLGCRFERDLRTHGSQFWISGTEVGFEKEGCFLVLDKKDKDIERGERCTLSFWSLIPNYYCYYSINFFI